MEKALVKKTKRFAKMKKILAEMQHKGELKPLLPTEDDLSEVHIMHWLQILLVDVCRIPNPLQIAPVPPPIQEAPRDTGAGPGPSSAGPEKRHRQQDRKLPRGTKGEVAEPASGSDAEKARGRSSLSFGLALVLPTLGVQPPQADKGHQRKRRFNNLERVAEEAAQRKAEAAARADLARREAEERQQRREAAEKARRQKSKTFRKVNGKGQPLMRHRVDDLLAKLQGEKQAA